MGPTSRGLELPQEEPLLIGCLEGQPPLTKPFMKHFLASEAAMEDASGLLSSGTELPLVCVKNGKLKKNLKLFFAFPCLDNRKKVERERNILTCIVKH